MRDNNDQAQGSCIDLRVQGETDHSAVEEESKRSLIKSLMKQILDSPWTYGGLIINKRRQQGVPRDPQDAMDIVQEQGNLEAHELLMITDTVLCKL